MFMICVSKFHKKIPVEFGSVFQDSFFLSATSPPVKLHHNLAAVEARRLEQPSANDGPDQSQNHQNHGAFGSSFEMSLHSSM